MKQKSQSGNALFLILIAIFLLGALTVLMTRQSSTTDETGEAERDAIKATEILRSLTSIEAGVQKLIASGCSENEISFWTDTNGDGNENASDDYYNPNSPGDRSCHLFNINGAGLNSSIIKTSWLDSSMSSGSRYGKILATASNIVIGVGKDTPDGADLMVIVPYVTKAVCESVNKLAGINAIPGEHGPYNAAAGIWEFKGAYTALGAFGDDSGYANYAALLGKKTACMQAMITPAANSYHAYHILLAR